MCSEKPQHFRFPLNMRQKLNYKQRNFGTDNEANKIVLQWKHKRLECISIVVTTDEQQYPKRTTKCLSKF